MPCVAIVAAGVTGSPGLGALARLLSKHKDAIAEGTSSGAVAECVVLSSAHLPEHVFIYWFTLQPVVGVALSCHEYISNCACACVYVVGIRHVTPFTAVSGAATDSLLTTTVIDDVTAHKTLAAAWESSPEALAENEVRLDVCTMSCNCSRNLTL
jgi:hypothetical protein